LRERVVRDPWFAAMIVAGVLVRLVLIPITHGNDFVVWDKASAATLHGVNIYEHPPEAVSGPFAYFPLFVYLELPFQWLAQHTAISFTVLGKLPILAGDLATVGLLVRELRERGLAPKVVTLAGAAFFLNPLVIYNSAWYGRFDTLGCALLLAAYRGLRRGPAGGARTALYYALAVAMKTFPGFALAGVIKAARGFRRQLLVILVVVLLVLSAPYLGTPHALVRQIVFWDAGKTPRGLAWQHVLLNITDAQGAKIVSYGLLVVFALATIALARELDLDCYIAFVLVLFIVCSKLVFEQYLIWPLPWLVLLAVDGPVRLRRAASALIALFVLAGMFDNESFHPAGRSPAVPNLVLAAGCVAFLVIGIRAARGAERAAPGPIRR
jgi:hypothetical protein